MSETKHHTLAKTLAFASVVEVGTGLVLMIDPAIVVPLLLGEDVSGPGIALGRCVGIALLALGLACWPWRPLAGRSAPAWRAMLIYNALLASYLARLGTVGNLHGLLLWPGVGAARRGRAVAGVDAARRASDEGEGAMSKLLIRIWAIQILLLVLVLMYCAIRELARVIGKEKVLRIFFGPMPGSPL